MKSKYLIGLLPIIIATTACTRTCSDDECVVDQTYVHKYGVAVPSDFWTSSGEHGSVISTMADGVVITRTYAAGLLDGDTSYTFPHSYQIQKTETYNQGTIVKETEFFFDGTPKREVLYDSPLGLKTVSTWYMSGTPKNIEQYSGDLLLSGQYYTLQNQQDANINNYEGTRLVRDDYGQLVTTDDVRGGQLTLRTTYHPNGSPKEQAPYQNGQMHGTKRTFHPAGEPNTFEEWSDGLQHGQTVIYQHGEKYAEVPYVNGNKHGVERRYRDGQEMVQEISWENGQLHGPSTTYVGETAKSDWYFQGAPTSKSDFEFMSNKPVAR